MSDEKLTSKDYSSHSSRVLNRLIKLRMKQIECAETGKPTSDKNIGQLRYELQNMANTLMERAMVK